MAWFKFFSCGKILALSIVFVLVASLLVFPLSQVAEANFFTEIIARIQILVKPPLGQAPTGRRVGGAGRGPICALAKNEQSYKFVKALMLTQPVNERALAREKQETETDSNTEFVGGLTIAAQPTFLFYLPYTTPQPPQNLVAQFVLLDDMNHPVWNELMAVELSDTPRLVEYLLSYSLEIGKLYNWYFSVICDSDKLSRNPVVRGWIQRAEPTPELQDALRNASRFEQYLAYANNGIWFDTVSSLVKIRRQFPGTYRGAWLNLLDYFQIPRVNQFDGLESVRPVELEVVSGNQLPTKM